MTSRTHRPCAGNNQQGGTRPSPSARQQRRHEALERYLAGEPIAVICREMGCAKSWLYMWKKRYQVTEPDWVQERSRRPATTSTKVPDALAAAIVRLRQTLAPDGSGPVSADVIRDHRRQHGSDAIPSRRTIYRILNRQAKEVHAPSFPSYVSDWLSQRSSGQRATCIDHICIRTGGKAVVTRGLRAKGSHRTAFCTM